MINVLQLFKVLQNHYGPCNWWPAETPFEVVVGAILTQNTNWNNVETAITNLRQANALTANAIIQLPRNDLEQLIRPSGFFRQKAERLKLFCQYLDNHYQGKLQQFLQQDINPLRKELLALKGIGPETADSILLYAGQLPSFVVDAYTIRLLSRLDILTGTEKYPQIREFFMDNLPTDVQLYNEYHALIVNHCKKFCRKRPICDNCPCQTFCRNNN